MKNKSNKRAKRARKTHKGYPSRRAKPTKKAVEDFAVYAKGVRRLSQLRDELDSINTSKFKRDAAAIRRKLNSVHLIPEIEHDLRELKAKVSGVDMSYEKTKVDKKQSKKISVLEKKDYNVTEFQDKLAKMPDLRRQIGNLRERILKDRKQKGVEKKEIKEIKEKHKKDIVKEKQEIKEVEEKVRKIPALQKKLLLFAQVLGGREQKIEKELEKEKEDVKEIKEKLAYLKRKTSVPVKNKLLREIKDLSTKIDKNKLEMHAKLTEEISESKWVLERDKKQLREELGDIVAESKWLIDQQAKEINEQLLDEIKELNKKLEKDKKEVYDKLLSKLVKVKAEVDAMRKMKENELKNPQGVPSTEGKKQKPRFVTEEMPQPFLPPPEFSEIKVKEIPAPKIRKLKKQKLIDIDFGSEIELIKPKKHQKQEFVGDTDIPALPELPRVDFSKIRSELPELAPEGVPPFGGNSGELAIEDMEVPEPQTEKEYYKLPPSFLKKETKESLGDEQHKLPVISKQEFMEDLKEAIDHEVGELRYQMEEDIARGSPLKKPSGKPSSDKKAKPIKNKVFMKLEEFKQTEQSLSEVDLNINMIEQELRDSISSGNHEVSKLGGIITEAEKIGSMLSKVDNSILRKIKQV